MERMRIKQAEELIKKACIKQKKTMIREPEEGVINVKHFENALKELIRAEDYIYKSLPHHRLSREEAVGFSQHLLKAREKIDKILSDFKVLEMEDLKDKIRELSLDTLIITTKSDAKRVLAKKGIEAPHIIVTGAPLSVEDMKKINPRIPEKTLENIKKRIEHTKYDIERKIKKMGIKKVIVLAEPNPTSKLIAEKAKKLYNAKIILDNPKDITDNKLIKILSKQ
ncbi:MAG TPA: DUF2100 domain-containing protein [Methanothermobacter sp.]|jgi:hypothetical protein|uniref:DUF2100 domain-containing protein n=1 Tax=Methanothermobacter tenebrarum TaxID=680118 RepID=A0ABM7YC90_9EURY|nr:DUF2100 domain-containing protein [Methanothermobacter tenebrarum]MDD3453998.1 DUF2100 domain-containing protein [Methanobacteriales archaeon]MDI6882310.1 DUF2100 domain-containing protein [Methanothermobacter sp.]MDX9693573.1 DUF2100 domain-containing protein [Methanothermobacter sp.]BDH78853.1 hypothetical protein MTTB_02320 [Methanothermobacter tenebrarum]HHW17061.1 DUF2100 domain-containing protein [Methanothermobacter sp.]